MSGVHYVVREVVDGALEARCTCGVSFGRIESRPLPVLPPTRGDCFYCGEPTRGDSAVVGAGRRTYEVCGTCMARDGAR